MWLEMRTLPTTRVAGRAVASRLLQAKVGATPGRPLERPVASSRAHTRLACGYLFARSTIKVPPYALRYTAPEVLSVPCGGRDARACVWRAVGGVGRARARVRGDRSAGARVNITKRKIFLHYYSREYVSAGLRAHTNTHAAHHPQRPELSVLCTESLTRRRRGGGAARSSTPPKFATQGLLDSVKEARPLSPDAPA